jgi:hypothetical protein
VGGGVGDLTIFNRSSLWRSCSPKGRQLTLATELPQADVVVYIASAGPVALSTARAIIPGGAAAAAAGGEGASDSVAKSKARAAAKGNKPPPRAAAKAKAAGGTPAVSAVNTDPGGKRARGRPKRPCLEVCKELLAEVVECEPNGPYFDPSKLDPRRTIARYLKNLRDDMELPTTDKCHVPSTPDAVVIKKQMELARSLCSAWATEGRFTETMSTEYTTAKDLVATVIARGPDSKSSFA